MCRYRANFSSKEVIFSDVIKFVDGGIYMWIFSLLVVIGVGTIVGFLKEQSSQNKRIIDLLEEISKNK